MKVRIKFAKAGHMKFVGHLDTMRYFQKAIRRSGLPIAYSNGFNPHIVMSFASALSSGIPGDAELLDVSLKGEATAEECMAAMNHVLPPALQVSRVRIVDDRFPKVSAALRQAEYTITLRAHARLRPLCRHFWRRMRSWRCARRNVRKRWSTSAR